MTFEDRWGSIWKASGLPNMARVQIPACLTDQTKKMLANSNISDVKLGRFFSEAVDKINHGSVAGIDKLIKAELP